MKLKYVILKRKFVNLFRYLTCLSLSAAILEWNCWLTLTHLLYRYIILNILKYFIIQFNIGTASKEFCSKNTVTCCLSFSRSSTACCWWRCPYDPNTCTSTALPLPVLKEEACSGGVGYHSQGCLGPGVPPQPHHTPAPQYLYWHIVTLQESGAHACWQLSFSIQKGVNRACPHQKGSLPNRIHSTNEEQSVFIQ